MDETANFVIKPLKIGVRLKPPALVLLYLDSHNSYHRRRMPFHQLAKNSVVSKVVEALKQRHQEYLENVPDFQIEKMIRLAQEHMKGNSIDTCMSIVAKEFANDPDEDLNKLDDTTLKRRKEIMSESFVKNRKKPGDEDFEYDVRVEFNPDETSDKLDFDSEEEDGKPLDEEQ